MSDIARVGIARDEMATVRFLTQPGPGLPCIDCGAHALFLICNQRAHDWLACPFHLAMVVSLALRDATM